MDRHTVRSLIHECSYPVLDVLTEIVVIEFIVTFVIAFRTKDLVRRGRNRIIARIDGGTDDHTAFEIDLSIRQTGNGDTADTGTETLGPVGIRTVTFPIDRVDGYRTIFHDSIGESIVTGPSVL